jgi:hypothetical protein
VRGRLVCAGLALAISVLVASPAAAAPNSLTGLSWLLGLDRKLESHLTANCTFPDGLGWVYGGPPHAKQHGYGTVPPSADPAKGTYDPGTRTGSAIGKGAAMIFDPVFASQGSGGHAFLLQDMGVTVSPHKVVLTGVIRPTRSRAAAKKRERLAVISKPHFSAGPRPDVVGKPYSSSYRFVVTGRAKITRKLAAALSRARCSAPRFAAHSKGNGPIKAGTVLGNVTVGLLPATATGLTGHAYLQSPGLRLENSDDLTRVAVTPTGSVVPEKIGHTRYLRFDLAPGTRVPLTCDLGVSCVPSPGAVVPLAGGFTFALNGTTAALDGVAVGFDATPNQTITGTLNGAPVTVAADGGLTDDFLNQLEAALGAPLDGDISPVGTLFSSVGAA